MSLHRPFEYCTHPWSAQTLDTTHRRILRKGSVLLAHPLVKRLDEAALRALLAFPTQT